MKAQKLAAVVAVSISLSACTSTKQFADLEFKPPQGDYRLIVMQPDVSVGLKTAGGSVEPREEWTNKARANLIRSIEAQQAGRGGVTKVAATREEAGGDLAAVADLDRLHKVVGQSIKIHKYAGAKLPTKKGVFDWTLGNQAVQFGAATNYGYALFLHAEDSFASTGRVAVQALSLVGCVVGFCQIPSGGQQAAFASLVDLKTGKVVWYNALSSSVGDIREQEGADKMIAELLGKMKPGAEQRASLKKKKG